MFSLATNVALPAGVDNGCIMQGYTQKLKGKMLTSPGTHTPSQKSLSKDMQHGSYDQDCRHLFRSSL